MAKISVYIPVLNEEDKIEDALKSVLWADEIVIIDTGCTDNTIAIALKYTNTIIPHTFQGFGKLRNAGIDACSNPWILSIDADERCTPELTQEIKQTLDKATLNDAYWIPRLNWFMGRWIRHSGWYPDYCQPKLFRKDAMRYNDEDIVHEGWKLTGTVGFLKANVIHFSFQDLSHIVKKMDNYALLGAEKLKENGRKGGFFTGLFRGFWSFFRTYILKRGFLDGKAGFIIALFNGIGVFNRYVTRAWKNNGWDQPPKL